MTKTPVGLHVAEYQSELDGKVRSVQLAPSADEAPSPAPWEVAKKTPVVGLTVLARQFADVGIVL